MEENSEQGDFVGRVNATDLDDQHLLSFEIIDGNTSQAFVIEATTGLPALVGHHPRPALTRTPYLLTVLIAESHLSSELKLTLTSC